MKSNGLEHIKGNKMVKKAGLVRMDLSKLPNKLPEFKKSKVTKDVLIASWLENWIKEDLKSGKIHPQELLPKKDDLAAYLGISTGTVQNAIRYIEDAGLVESKQRIGTLIKDQSVKTNVLRKQSSKRDGAIYAIKKYIIDNDCKVGENLPSSRELSKIIGSAPNTARLALEYLASTGIIKAMGNRGNKANWLISQIPSVGKSNKEIGIKTDTLVSQVERDLKNYIQQNFSAGDKLPAHMVLSKDLKVSIKTIHDAIKSLIKDGILSAKRGRYGTTILRLPNDAVAPRPEDSIFAPAQDAVFYNYEKIERHIKNMIAEKYSVGQKLPSMSELAKELDVSGNTIRKALQNLAKECILEFARGKYGGTFVVNMPKIEAKQPKFAWLSVNKEHIKAYRGLTEAK
ncbi:MAG: GntR family transcriptional regulator [bacterium]|nr:GntR family transcriptional regulator [bacterium]